MTIATFIARPEPRPRERVAPGLLLCAAVGAAAMAVQRSEIALFGRAWLEGLVLAILLGAAVRTAWTPGPGWQPGIRLAAKTLLEVAVVLLGLSISGATLLAVGPALLAGIAGVVVVAIIASYGIGRALGLSPRLAALVACGNSICGNSAIAAVAPVIGADGQDVAAAIAFTAVLGVGVVIGLPLLALPLHVSPLGFGALAGLTVYAVPQVLATAAPLGALAVQMGTLVKLVRVLMLGPVCLALAVVTRHCAAAGRPAAAAPWRAGVAKALPWFIIGFLTLLGLRSAGLVPPAALAPAREASDLLTLASMAALGLGCDICAVARAGGHVTLAATLSLAVLGALSWTLLRLLGLA